jgi:hypothetical protein
MSRNPRNNIIISVFIQNLLFNGVRSFIIPETDKSEVSVCLPFPFVRFPTYNKKITPGRDAEKAKGKAPV